VRLLLKKVGKTVAWFVLIINPRRMLAIAEPARHPRGSNATEGSCAEHRLNPRKFSIKCSHFIGLTNKIPLREQALDGDFIVQTTKINLNELDFLKFTYYYCRRKGSANIPSIISIANYRFLKRLLKCFKNRYVLLRNTICADQVDLALIIWLLGVAF